ncbi:MAG: hypothetical protein ACLTD3_09875 [Blautia sp.]
MENGYENFVDTLRQSLLKETSYEEEMICYKKAEEYPPTSGDRLLLKNRQKEGVYEVCGKRPIRGCIEISGCCM